MDICLFMCGYMHYKKKKSRIKRIPVFDQFASRTLLRRQIPADHTGIGGRRRHLAGVEGVEIGVDHEVFGSGVLHEVEQAKGDNQGSDDELKEPVEIQRKSEDMHRQLRRIPRFELGFFIDANNSIASQIP